jgi:hypothetical protein
MEDMVRTEDKVGSMMRALTEQNTADALQFMPP